MKTILVTGGAGYIGSHTADELSRNGYNVIILDNFSEGHREFAEGYKVCEVDLADIDSIREVFVQNKIDAVVHFAAFAYVGESVHNPQKYYYNNVVNTLNLLNAMIENDVKKIVFSSTCATYGNPEYTPLDEKHSQNPINPYGNTKFMIEKIFKDYDRAYGLKYFALRYFNAAGASTRKNIGEWHRIETHLIPLVLKTLTGERENITIFGDDYSTPDGTCIRDYIHVDDLASAHRLAVEKLLSGSNSDFINLGTGVGNSVKEIISSVERVTGKKVPVVMGERREGDPDILYASNTKAKNFLGWKVEYTNIDDIVKTAWDWELKLKSLKESSVK